MQEWKQFRNTRYAVSTLGEVANADTLRILAQTLDLGGYPVVNLYDPAKHTVRVHRMVAECFIANPKNLPVVNHLDGNKQHNTVTNLEWCTHSENTQHAYDIGTKPKGSALSWSILSEAQVESIKLRFVMGDTNQPALAAEFGVAASSISQIYRKVRWKHVRPDLDWAISTRKPSTRKITASDIPDIRASFAAGESDTVIASRYNVNRGTIFQIRCGKNWKNY
jgi:hypothetical protein